MKEAPIFLWETCTCEQDCTHFMGFLEASPFLLFLVLEETAAFTFSIYKQNNIHWLLVNDLEPHDVFLLVLFTVLRGFEGFLPLFCHPCECWVSHQAVCSIEDGGPLAQRTDCWCCQVLSCTKTHILTPFCTDCWAKLFCTVGMFLHLWLLLVKENSSPCFKWASNILLILHLLLLKW